MDWLMIHHIQPWSSSLSLPTEGWGGDREGTASWQEIVSICNITKLLSVIVRFSSRKLINLQSDSRANRRHFPIALHWFENCRMEVLIIEDIDWPDGHWRCPLHADDYHDEGEINICSGIISLIQFHTSMRTDITPSRRVSCGVEGKLLQKFGTIDCSAWPQDTAPH